MRAVHLCDVCDFRLPYCVRSDRRFCSSRCRVWLSRHPGCKRADPGWGRVRLPNAPSQGQPRTLAAALLALQEWRKYAAKLEATALAQKLAEQKLLNEQTALRIELARAKSALASTQEERDDAKQRFTQAAQATDKEAQAQREKVAELQAQIKQATDELETQRQQVKTLSSGKTTLQGRAESAEKQLALRDEEIRRQQHSVTAAERANQEVQVVAAQESRRLRAEKALRLAAEKRVADLLHYIESEAHLDQPARDADDPGVSLEMRASILNAELQAIRQYSDEIDAERELLATRILRLMAPGQYLAHATAAGYDVTRDPLIRLKREEIRVENRYHTWQVIHKKPRRARRLDPEQTIDEQAYAGALASRWRLIDRPHRRQKHLPKWIAIGILLDPPNEEFVLARTQERIDGMLKRMQESP